MAGHSKWSKVKHIKGALDAKRSKVFAKITKEIIVAVKVGASGDPNMNPRLRLVLMKARAANMPNDNIDRAIKKASGEGFVNNYEDLIYEIYGPAGVAILVEISTDNRNRTSAEIRAILTRNNGSLATSGAVSRLFQKKGQFIIERENANEDTLMELAMEAGAEDFKSEEEGFEIITDPSLAVSAPKTVMTVRSSCDTVPPRHNSDSPRDLAYGRTTSALSRLCVSATRHSCNADPLHCHPRPTVHKHVPSRHGHLPATTVRNSCRRVALPARPTHITHTKWGRGLQIPLPDVPFSALGLAPAQSTAHV